MSVTALSLIHINALTVLATKVQAFPKDHASAKAFLGKKGLIQAVTGGTEAEPFFALTQDGTDSLKESNRRLDQWTKAVQAADNFGGATREQVMLHAGNKVDYKDGVSEMKAVMKAMTKAFPTGIAPVVPKTQEELDAIAEANMVKAERFTKMAELALNEGDNEMAAEFLAKAQALQDLIPA